MLNKRAPRVSMLMTTYNPGAVVRETVDSILSQTFDDFELVIVDDCSTDDTPAVIQAYDDPRIHFSRNEENLGISRTRNRAIALARGDYLAATDHDDLSLPERLERQVDYLDSHPDTVLVGTAAKELRDGRLRSCYPGELRPHILDWRLHTRCGIVHSSICYRGEVLRKNRVQYRSEYHYAEDFALFGELSDFGNIVVLPEELVVYRESDGNASTQHIVTMNHNGMHFLRERYRDTLDIDLDLEQMNELWRLFNIRAPATSTQQVMRVGHLYMQILTAYLERRSWPEEQASDIRKFASHEWWRAVSTFCRTHGRFDNIKLYRGVTGLGHWQPGVSTLGKSFAKSALRRLYPRS